MAILINELFDAFKFIEAIHILNEVNISELHVKIYILLQNKISKIL